MDTHIRRSRAWLGAGAAAIVAFVAGLAMPDGPVESPTLQVHEETVDGVTYRCLVTGSAMWCERIWVTAAEPSRDCGPNGDQLCARTTEP